MKRQKALRGIVVAALLTSLSLTGLIAPAVAATDPVATMLKAFGIGLVVKTFSSQINDAVNTLTLNKSVGVKDSTKVVPIISLGTGAHIGAAQVSGPAAQVSKVAAVAQLEGEFSERAFRVKALVPVNGLDPKSLQRVTGVGVSAILDFRL